MLYRYTNWISNGPPHVAAWYEHLRQRPAYREQVMTPFEDLKGRLSF